jgi:hypothetical protein
LATSKVLPECCLSSVMNKLPLTRSIFGWPGATLLLAAA